MSAAAMSQDSRERRMALVAEHVRCENAHDLHGVIQTFGDSARYDVFQLAEAAAAATPVKADAVVAAK